MELDSADQVWNRANQYPAPPDSELGPGDRALRDLALAHNAVMNGGVDHAIDLFDAEALDRADAGYRYFGLDDAADALRAARKAPGDEDVIERMSTIIWTADERLRGTFRERFARDAALFAPLSDA